VGQPVHAISGGHDRKYVAAAVADAYRALGEGYKSHENGYRERMTTAVINAYERLSA
jgi:hypothetical protein